MVLVGVVLLVLCVLLAAGIALPNTDTVSAEAFGVTLSNVSLRGLFLTGVVVGALAMLGLGLTLIGAARKRSKKVALKREVKHVRVEQDSLTEENARLHEQLAREHAAGMPPADTSATGDGTPVTGDGRGRHGV